MVERYNDSGTTSGLIDRTLNIDYDERREKEGGRERNERSFDKQIPWREDVTRKKVKRGL